MLFPRLLSVAMSSANFAAYATRAWSYSEWESVSTTIFLAGTLRRQSDFIVKQLAVPSFAKVRARFGCARRSPR